MTPRRSPTADFLKRAIERSGRTQAEIARDAGFSMPNVLSMMKTGQTKIPIDRIPALAAACGVDAARLLRIALTEYQPEAWQVIRATLGEPLTEVERDLLHEFRASDPQGDIAIDEKTRALLRPIFATLAERARCTCDPRGAMEDNATAADGT